MTSRARRSGADSRVCDPSGAPYVWHRYVDEDHADVTAIEQWLASLARFARLNAVGRIRALHDRAARGELEDSGDARTPITAIHHDPEIYELRLKELSKAFRFYHGEPAEWPSRLIQVHQHIKVSGSQQQGAIEYAARRYRAGQPYGWEQDH